MNVSTLLDVIIACFAGLWAYSIVMSFVASHREFKAREANYHRDFKAICRRIELGLDVDKSDIEKLSLEDQIAILHEQIDLLRNKSSQKLFFNDTMMSMLLKVACLDELESKIINFIYFDNLDYNQIAEKLENPINVIEDLHKRALRKINAARRSIEYTDADAVEFHPNVEQFRNKNMFRAITWIDQRQHNLPIHVRTTIEVCSYDDNGEPKKYAVRCMGNRLSKEGKWYFEPTNSNRSEQFVNYCSFNTYNDAVSAASAFPQGTSGIEVLSWTDKNDDD